jgi:hypothetical protein
LFAGIAVARFESALVCDAMWQVTETGWIHLVEDRGRGG